MPSGPLFIVSFVLSLLLFCLTERIVNAVLCLFFRDKRKSEAKNILSHFLSLFFHVVFGIFSVLFRGLALLSIFALWILVVFVVLSFLFVSYEEYPVIWLKGVDAYNAHVGPFVHEWFLLPLQVLNVFLKGFIPVWNSFFYFFRMLWLEGLIPLVSSELDLIKGIGLTILQFGRSCAFSISDYLKVASCPADICIRQVPELNVSAPMEDVAQLSLLMVKIVDNACSPLSVPFRLLLYPFHSTHLGTAVHNLLNAVLSTVVYLPISTFQRCQRFGGSGLGTDALMCTPDLEVVKIYLISFLNALGKMLDDWIAVGYKTLITAGDRPAVLTNINPDFFREGIIEGALISLGVGNSLIATTNGSYAVFFGMNAGSTVTLRHWSNGGVDLSFGIAAVRYGSVSAVPSSLVAANDPNTLLGCSCIDTSDGVGIRCRMLPFSGTINATQLEFDVGWQDATWRKGMTCSAIEVTVRSVRWSLRRTTGLSLGQPLQSCVSANTCENVDATIWLVPKCMYLPAAQCSYDATGTSCFPYCMATRKAKSLNQQPVFVSAATWRNGYQLMDRDCTSSNKKTSASLSFANAGQVSSIALQPTSMPAPPLFLNGDSVGCSFGAQTVSWVTGNTSQAKKGLPFSLVNEQPFAVAGDAVLIAEKMGDGGIVVHAERLTGDQQNVFSLTGNGYTLPAMPITLVPADQFKLTSSLVVPYSFQQTRVLATSNSAFFFYATNPDMLLFQAYFDFCVSKTEGGESLPRVQQMLLSSYSPLRVYRVCAYGPCATPVAQFTWNGFSNGTASSTFTALKVQCDNKFNFTISGLEYVNEANIAVTVGETSSAFDPVTQTGVNVTYRTYWLHPYTMQVRLSDMWSLTQTTMATGSNLPALGSMGASLLNAGFLLFYMGLEAVVYGNGMFQFFKGGGVCPLQSAGHSMLESCGGNFLVLDDFFDNLEDATQIFWGTLEYAADILYDNGVEFSPLQDTLRGLSTYGENTVDILSAASATQLLAEPVHEQMRGVFAALRNQNFAAASVRPMVTGLSMARYFWTMFLHAGRRLLQQPAGQQQSASTSYHIFMESIYETRGEFTSLVVHRGISACAGLGRIFGSTRGNPVGKLVDAMCVSSVEFSRGIFDMWLILTVDVELVKCVCVTAGGQPVGYIDDVCVPQVPSFMRALVQGISGEVSSALNCKRLLPEVSSNIKQCLEPWFGSMYSGVDVMTEVIDYATIEFDPDAGQCMNWEQNPFVVVIVPQPVDYFQGCAMTSMCHSRCQSDWNRLQQGLAAYTPASTTANIEIPATVESKFFPVGGGEIESPGTIVAMTQPSQCSLYCSQSTDNCFAAAFLDGATLGVNFYCVPVSTTQNVYLSTKIGGSPARSVNWDVACPECNAASKIQFTNSNGGGLVLLVSQTNGNYLEIINRGSEKMVVLNASITNSDSIPLLKSIKLQPVVMQEVFVLSENLFLVNLVVRSQQGKTSRVSLQVTSGSPNATALVVPAIPAFSGYVWSKYEGVDRAHVYFVVWPLGTLQEPQLLSVVANWTDLTILQTSVTKIPLGENALGTATELRRNAIVSLNGQFNADKFVAWVCSGEQYNWLSQLRVQGIQTAVQSVGVFKSMSSSITVQTSGGCDGSDCSGCPDASIRALCSTYQRCSVFNCIGTPVNLNRPLCGIGLILRAMALTQLETLHGAWGVIVQMFVVMLQLRVQSDVGVVDLSAQEEAFFGHVCAAKDVSAEFFATVVASANLVFDYDTSRTILLQYASFVDPQVHSTPSLAPSAITGFFYHISLAPIYVASTMYQILLCRLTALVAIVDKAGGPTIVLTKMNYTSAATGQCLTLYAAGLASETGNPASRRQLATSAANLIQVAADSVTLAVLDPIMHTIDATLTYLIGIVSSFATVLQTFDMMHCVTPDVTLSTTAQCACGDQQLQISAARAAETQYAYWCTGTLSLLMPDQTSKLVWNPFSFQQLRAKMDVQLEDFLACSQNVSRSCTIPNDPVFVAQGVNTMQVFTRCRQNYVNKQWDVGAYAQYDENILKKHVPASLRASATKNDVVGPCLLNAFSTGQNNQACTDGFFQAKNWNADNYWAYETESTSRPSRIDGCIVFSGPAKNQEVSFERTSVFADCMGSNPSNQTCMLSGFVWSPSSVNSVPVASLHVITGQEGSVRTAVETRYTTAFEKVQQALSLVDQDDLLELEAAFFSAEGDVIHQLLDCLFLGPFARMDYWPMPFCPPGAQNCLQGPVWARDDGQGVTRNVHPSSCAASSVPPFTCGTPTRKNMIKYFVQTYISQGKGGADLVRQHIREWTGNMSVLWGNLSKFQCKCDNDTMSPFCCENLDNLTMQLTAIPDFIVSTDSILKNLERMAVEFYEDSLMHSAPWVFGLSQEEVAAYTWQTLQQAPDVVKDARFDTTTPLYDYTQQHAMSPPTSSFDPGLWETCHGAIRQIFFTMPVSTDGNLVPPPELFGGGGVEAIAAYVSQLVAASFTNSPLYHHYVTRHAPSQSRMCAHTRNISHTTGKLTYSNVKVGEVLVFSDSPVISTLGMDAGVLGAWDNSCFCSWILTAAGDCLVPGGAAALALGVSSYSLSTQDRQYLSSKYAPTWDCPELDLSEHYGILDRDASEWWLRGNATLISSGTTLLQYGPGGLKVGNLHGVDRSQQDYTDYVGLSTPLSVLAKEKITPATRNVDPKDSVLHACDPLSKAHVDDLLTDFVDDLFPMSQGVYEAGSVSYCLRFAIELSKLRALEMLGATQNTSNLELLERTASQQKTTGVWQRRCGSQVQLVAMCGALDIYHGRESILPSPCTFWSVPKQAIEMYVTPGCMVNINGTFYDPCECFPSICPAANNDTQIPAVLTAEMFWKQPTKCSIALDPRKITRKMEMGWWESNTATGNAFNSWLSNYANLLLIDTLTDETLDPSSRIGNPSEGAHWSTAEGYMNETATFCDMIVDYWPDDAVFPVGYHVTVPCLAEDTGYRSFDNVFAQDNENNMVYMEDQTRDMEKIDSLFGAGGLCRSTNFGFNMYVTNTMKICTRRQLDDNVDIHVPQPDDSDGNQPEYDSEFCSASAGDLPWGGPAHQDFYDPLMQNVGTVPFLPDTNAPEYPYTTSSGYAMGPVEDMVRNGWGDGCSDFDLPYCSDSLDCAEGYNCMQGVCMHEKVECFNHKMCQQPNMCSGDGRCLPATVVVFNALDVNASFKTHTTACSDTSYSMLGASPWGYMPDLLQAHGMCSYRDWTAYQNTWYACVSDAQKLKTQATVDGTQCQYYMRDMGVDSSKNSQVKWWDNSSSMPRRLRLEKVSCDRDYERFSYSKQEMQACIPSTALFRGSNYQSRTATRERILRPYDVQQRTTSVRNMPFKNNRVSGFLNTADSTGTINTQSCSSLRQCFMAKFTRNGFASMMTNGTLQTINRKLIDGTWYNAQDTFQCGIYARFRSSTGLCEIDHKVVPLYNFLCLKRQTLDPTNWCATALGPTGETDVQQWCNIIQDNYQPLFSVIQANTDALTGLLTAYGKVVSEDLNTAVAVTECALLMYNYVNTLDQGRRTLYFPFSFVLYEFPFSWFYQCIMTGQVSPVLTQNKWKFPCAAYSRAATANVTNYETTSASDTFREYVQTVRGGYTSASVNAYMAQSLQKSQTMWSQCVAKTVQEKFNANDNTKPQCSDRTIWRPLQMKYNKYARYLIQTFIYPTCSAIVQNRTLMLYNQNPLPEFDLSFITKNNIDILEEVLVTCPTGNYINQDEGTRTVMQMIEQWGHSRLQENILPLLKDVSLSQKFPVQFDDSIPLIHDDLLAELVSNPEFQLKPDLKVSDVEYADEAIACPTPQVDLYQRNDDPYVAMGAEQPMQVCPVHSRGRFQCHYPAYEHESQRIGVFANSSLTQSSQMKKYLDGLFQGVHSCYNGAKQNSPVPPLAPTELSFFKDESSLGFKNFQFDLTYVAQYTAEINPNTDTSIMCTVGNQELQFTNCTDQNYAALQNHVQTQYTKDGPVVIPTNLQMEWKPSSRNMLTSNSIYSFASTERPLRNQFVWQMMDSDASCVSLGTDNNDRVCTLTGTTKNVLTPWTAGSWNPYDGCDVYNTINPTERNEELIDARCEAGPPWCNSNGNMGTTQSCNSVTGQQCFYDNMPVKSGQTQCKDRDRQKTTRMNVRPSLYNLCSHEVEQDAVCTHIQGVLGGGDGFSLPNNNLYTLVEFNHTEDFGQTLFANPLFTGTCEAYSYGVLRIPDTHLGGNVLGLKLEWINETTKEEACLRVAKIPLKGATEKMLEEWESADVQTGWVQDLPLQYSTDEAAYITTLGIGVVTPAWDCPLRRRAFYSNGVVGWGPSLPSARRSKRLFATMNDDSYAHPTQKRSDAAERFGQYTTYNGFCFCPDLENPQDEQCQIATTLAEKSHACSLLGTVEAIAGVKWQSSFTFKPLRQKVNTKCNVQLDWPFVGGDMRDGTPLHTSDTSAEVWADASDQERRKCHVLDRMKEFNYTYRSLGPLESSQYNTLQHGVCHTGRVQDTVQTTDRCVRSIKNSQECILLCSQSASKTTYRRKSRTPWQAVKNRRRQRCNQCSKTPDFKTRKGVKMQAESSFGLPYRYAAERVMAADLKEALCSDSATCINSLNKTAWKTGQFLKTFLHNPSALFLNYNQSKNLSKSDAFKITVPPDDSELWAKPWMYCPTQTAMATGINCTGAITREQWRESKKSFCPKAIQEGSRGQISQVISTSMCEISGSLSNLCAVLTEARNLIGSANCLKDSATTANPLCAIKEHVYTPATWENSNMAFVHETVTNFYKRMDTCPDNSDCICPADYNVTLIRQQNQQLLSHCSAKDASAVALFLTQARGLVQQLTQIIANILSLALQLILSLQAGDAGAAAKTRMYQGWFSLSSMLENAKGSVSDIGTNTILMNGVVGPALRIAVREACGAYNMALHFFVDSYCVFVTDKLVVFASSLDGVLGYVDVALTTINDFITILVKDILPQALVAMVYKGYDKMTSGLMFTSRLRTIQNEKALLATVGVVGKLSEQAQTTGSLAAKLALADSTKAMQNANDAVKTKGILTKAFDKLAVIDKYALPVAVAAGVVTGIKEIVESEKNRKALEDAQAKAPEVWTYVDFSTIRIVLQDMIEYLSLSNEPCLSPPRNLTCPNFTLPNTGVTNTTYLPPQPTQCWADAQIQDYGITNLYACSPASTCMVDAASSSTVMCAECPLQQSSLYVPYGCNVMVQRCQCNILSTRATTCTTNNDCSDSGYCSLRKDVGGVSFGVNMCGSCSTPSVCIVQTPGSPGSCSCLGNSNPYQLCDSTAVGQQLLPKTPLLELYSTQPSSELYLWGDCAFIPAAQVRRAICKQVATASGTMTMAMALNTYQSTVSQASRRLLAEADYVNEVFTDYPDFFTSASPSDHLSIPFLQELLQVPGWNTTASPCSTVALAFQHGHTLTPTDENTAHTCAYWRHVGGIIIKEFNLTSMTNLDTFLLSADDFAAAIAHKGVLNDLVSHPSALLTAAMYSSWLKPIRAVFWLRYHEHFRKLFQKAEKYWGSLVSKSQNSSVPVSHMFHIKKHKHHVIYRQQTRNNSNTSLIKQHIHRRKLLETPSDLLQTVQQSKFYNFFAQNAPPLANFSSLGTCQLADVMLTAGQKITRVTTNYYTHFDLVHAKRNLSTNIWSVFPKIQLPTFTADTMANWQSYGSYSGATVHTILSIFGINMDQVVEFFSAVDTKTDSKWIFNYIVTSLTSCDFAGVMMCQAHTKDFFSSLVLAFVFYMVVSSILSFFGVPIVGTLLFYSIPLMALWYSYGWSPLCFPIIPPCFADDLLSRLASVFPLSTTLPQGLFCSRNITSNCLVKCSSLGFDNWQDPIAYVIAAAGVDVTIPEFPQLYDASNFITGKNWTANLLDKRKMILSDDVDSYTVCSIVTAVSTLPVLLVLIGILVAVTSIVAYVMTLIPFTVTLFWQIAVPIQHQDDT